MESLNSKKSLVEEDANISLFRKRNKIIILVFSFLIISSALIIAALIAELVRIRNSNTRSHYGVVLKSPIESFCSVSNSRPACIKAFNPIINNRVIVDPDQFLTISLQTSVFEIQNILNSSTASDFHDCSRALRHALSQLGPPLAAMRVNPFVSSLSRDQRDVIRERVVAAGGDVKACVDDLARVERLPAGGAAAAEKLGEVEVYLDGGRDFLLRYELVARNWRTNFVVGASFERSLIYDYLFEIVMCGMQVLFMFGMFCALFRIR